MHWWRQAIEYCEPLGRRPERGRCPQFVGIRTARESFTGFQSQRDLARVQASDELLRA